MAREWFIEKTDYGAYTCPIHKSIMLIGDKWTLFILREFIYGAEKQSFNSLLRSLKPISSRTLSLKLKKMQKIGLVTKKVIRKERPMKVEYQITQMGKSLKNALQSIANWHKKYAP